MSAGPEEPRDPPGPVLSEREVRAAEYALGTLPGGERAVLEAERSTDPGVDAAIRDWERRLAPLSLAVPEVRPPETLWNALAQKLDRVESLDETGSSHAANDNRVVALAGQVRQWRFATAGMGLVAAGLALVVALGPRVPAPDTSGRYIAVVNSGGDAPALIVSVDTARGTAQVRPVAARAPAGKSLELWYVGGGKPPQSLGLVQGDASRIGLPAAAAGGEGAFAVSVEPPGGSQTGQPTGQVIYQGKLIRE